MYSPIWFHITRQGRRGRRGSQPEQDPHTFKIQINNYKYKSTCDKSEEKAK